MWTEVLEENGVAVVVLDSQHARLEHDDQAEVYRIVKYDRRVHPRDIGDPAATNSLLLAPVMSPLAAQTARRMGWSVVTEFGPAWVRFQHSTLELARDTSNADAAPLPSRQGRPGYGMFTVMRTLLSLDEVATQRELAEFAKVSQARVSQALRRLRDSGLVKRTADGWAVADRAKAVDWWVTRYPGAGGLKTHWFGLESPVRQVFRVYQLLAEGKARPAVSGDVAADLVTPWRVPQHGLLYAEHGRTCRWWASRPQVRLKRR